MKKCWLFLAFILTAQVNAFSIADDENWLGAYYFKNLSSIEKYAPFIDIRDHNYAIFSPGSAVRSMMASAIIIQNLSVIADLYPILSDNPTTIKITDKLKNMFATIKDPHDYERKLLELKAISIIKGEVINQQSYLQKILGSSWYDNFYYDFYNICLIEYETSIPVNFKPLLDYKFNPRATSAFKKSIDDLNLEYTTGVYFKKISVNNGALGDSVKFTERINSMIPIYPAAIMNSRSPLFSKTRTYQDNQLKETLKNQFQDKIDFEWRQKVVVQVYKFDSKTVARFIDYLNNFDESNIKTLKNMYGKNFNDIPVDSYNQKNLTVLLKEKIGK